MTATTQRGLIQGLKVLYCTAFTSSTVVSQHFVEPKKASCEGKKSIDDSGEQWWHLQYGVLTVSAIILLRCLGPAIKCTVAKWSAQQGLG
jgi:hypothetical protein